MRKRTKITMLSLFCFLAVLLGLFLFSSNLASSRFTSVEKLVKHFIGGRVINKSIQSVTVYDWRLPLTLPAQRHSRQESFVDVDALKIDGPTLVKGQLYQQGIFKFCDTATVTVSDQQWKGKTVKVFSTDWGSWVCQLTDDLAVFNSIEEATPISH